MPKLPADNPPVPSHLDWDLWIGPAKMRPYHPTICPYGWRFWWDYGTGETGNMGCHIFDIPFWALDLKYPTKVEASGPPVDAQRSSTSMTVKYEFPARGDRPPVTLHWYHTAKGPEILRERKPVGKGEQHVVCRQPRDAAVRVGSRELLPKEKFADFKAPAPSVARLARLLRGVRRGLQGRQAGHLPVRLLGSAGRGGVLGNVAYRAGASPGTPRR